MHQANGKSGGFREPTGQERDLADMFQGFGEAFCAFDSGWRITHYNQAAVEYAGLGESQALGRSYWDVVPAALGTPVEGIFRRAMRERISLEIELPSALRPGTIVLLRAFPLHGGLGVCFRDVSGDRVHAREAQEQAARLELALAASGFGDWSWDAASGVVQLSDRAAAIFGVPASDAMGAVSRTATRLRKGAFPPTPAWP